MQPIAVVWEDITGDGSWIALEDAAQLNPVVCVSVGYLVKKTKKKLVLAQTSGEHSAVNGRLSIPIGAIVAQGRVKLPPCATKRLRKFHK